jgi:PAS domain S-box-containing protein
MNDRTRESDESLRAAFEAAPVGMLVIDIDGAIVLVNSATEALFGYSREELCGQAVEMLVPEKFREHHPDLRNSFFAKPEVRGTDARLDLLGVRKDGGEFPVRIGLSRVDTGEGPCALATITDLTEAKSLEEERARDRALLEAIHLAQSQFILAEDPLGIFGEFLQSLISLTDSEYGFVDEMFYTTDGQPYLTARAITDISWSEESRKMYDQFVSGTLNFTNLQSLFGAVMTSGNPVIANDPSSDPRRTGIPSGHPPLNAFLGLPLHSSSQEFVGVIGLANRPGGYTEEIITYLEPMVAACANLIAARKNDLRRRQAEEELRLANEELEDRVEKRTAELSYANEALEQSNIELEQFAYIASHDLQTPLRAIAGFAQYLQRDYEGRFDERADEFIRFIIGGAKQMQTLINDLLAYSRIESRSEPFETTDLGEVFDSVVAVFDSTIKEAGAEVTCDELPKVVGDKSQLVQLLQNLISNGLKYRGVEPPRIHVSGIRNENRWTISVRDNGIGIEAKDHARIFDIFRRLHTDEEYPGTGIGLAVCRRIIQRHGGKIWLESQSGKGTIFYFTIPG